MQQAPVPENQAATDLSCQFCGWPLIKDGELKCFRSGHTVKATLGRERIFCPYCRKPKVLLAKNNLAICPKCEKGKKEGNLMIDQEREMVERFVPVCCGVLKKIDKKKHALEVLLQFGGEDYQYKEEIDTSFLNHRWSLRLTVVYASRFPTESWICFGCETAKPEKHISFSVEGNDMSKINYLNYVIKEIEESGENVKELIYQLTQGLRRAIAAFDEYFVETIKKQSAKIAEDIMAGKLKELVYNTPKS